MKHNIYRSHYIPQEGEIESDILHAFQTIYFSLLRLKSSVSKLVFFFFFNFFSICLDVPHLTNEHRTQDCIAS